MKPSAAWRSTNTGALLFAASSRVTAVKLAVVTAAGFALTDAQLALFHALDRGDARPTTLAACARLSKANMVDLIDRAERAGLVVRQPDPHDRRAKLVVPTAAGRRLFVALDAGLAAAEKEVAALLGAAAKTRLKDHLGRYVAAPAGPSARALLPGGAGSDWIAANVGRALALAAQRFVQDVATGVDAAGFDAGEAVLGLIRHLDLDGTRLTELAVRARLTKAAMGERVAQAERRGFVTRLPDAADARARRIAFTPLGLDLLDAARAAVASAEARLAAIIGQAAVGEVRHDLARLVVPADLADAA